MLNNIDLQTRKKSYLIGFGLSLALAVLALVLLFRDIEHVYTPFLILLGLSSMGMALYLIVSSSSLPQASLGVWFVVILALQHGGGWLLEQIFSEQHYSRFISFTDETIAKSVALAGVSLLVFAASYAYYNSSLRKHGKVLDCASEYRNSVIDQIPWSILLIWGVGFTIIQFGGGISSVLESSTNVYILQSVFFYLANPLVLLVSIKILASGFRLSSRVLLLLVVWTGFVFLTGQRQHIIVIGLSTLVLSSKWRLSSVTVKSNILLLLFLFSIAVGMIALRQTYGREFFSASLADRREVFTGDTYVDQGAIWDSLEYDLGYRLNAGNILLGLMAEKPVDDLLWIEPVVYSAVKMVPGFIWTTKLQDLTAGELPRLIADYFRLPVSDYIATYVTVFYAMGGLPMLILLSALFGSIVAFLDIRLAQSTSVFGLFMAIGLAGGLVAIDHSIDVLFNSVRNALLLYLVFKISISLRDAAVRR